MPPKKKKVQKPQPASTIIENSKETVVSSTTDKTESRLTSDESTIKPKEPGLRLMTIPTNEQEKFQCVVGKHVFVDTPWAQISYTKIMDDIETRNHKSCFWPFRKNLENIQNDYVLVAYKPFTNTDEEFFICTTDSARITIEENQALMKREMAEKVERSMNRAPGVWVSLGSEQEISDTKIIPERQKIKYLWRIPADRVQSKSEFEESIPKKMFNEYVRMEPRSKDEFKCEHLLMTQTGIQAVNATVSREMQTIPRIQDTKSFQSVAVEEPMFQPRWLTKSNKYIEAFFAKYVPYLASELHYNEVYDLYRDDYTMLQTQSKKSIKQRLVVLKAELGFRNTTPLRYVSCFSWHPTIPGIYAICYTNNSYVLQKTVKLNEPDEDVTKVDAEKEEKYGVVYSDDENDQKDPPDSVHTLDNYDGKLKTLLNKEYIQRMRIIQIVDYEEQSHQPVHDSLAEVRKMFVYVPYKDQQPAVAEVQKPSRYHRRTASRIDTVRSLDLSENFQDEIEENGMLDVNASHLPRTESSGNYQLLGESIRGHEGEFEMDEYGFPADDHHHLELSHKHVDTEKHSAASAEGVTQIVEDDPEDKDEVDAHDSDTDSFFQIWGEDQDWVYGNNLRNTVRKIHRDFEKKYDRRAKENKLFQMLMSEPMYTKRKIKAETLEDERKQLAKDMVHAGENVGRIIRKQPESKNKKKKKKSSVRQKTVYKPIMNEEESRTIREEMPLVEEQNNPVVIWSIDNNVFPMLRLDSPEEVACVQFNPRNGNTVVGGLVNGQICLWDITGKLEERNTYDATMSEKVKMHRKHLAGYMHWCLDVEYTSRVRPTALSSILESHTSIVTTVQWLHPMTEMTGLGKLGIIHGELSEQFLTSSMDGTLKLWDLHSKPVSKSKEKQKNIPKPRFGYPENLNKYKSPLAIYNNRLEPTYTIKVIEPEKSIYTPITTFSFEIPLMKYNYIAGDQPLTVGKRQYEFEASPLSEEPNQRIVVGSMMGQIGLITWNGYDNYHRDHNREDAKTIWWRYVHDGPINCIKRNPFLPNIHLICGGHIVSVWSLDYHEGPLWWNRFREYTTGGIWSSIQAGEFRISFETGVVEFWDFMLHAHEAFFISEVLSDGAITTLSAPLPIVHFLGTETFKSSKGISELVDWDKYEVICFSDTTGAVRLFSMDASKSDPNDVVEVGRLFDKEVERRRELNSWNEKYKEEFGSLGENNVEDYESVEIPIVDPVEAKPEPLTPEQVKRKICDEAFNWYMDRRGPQSRLGKMKELFIERERRHMIDAMMVKKRRNKKELEEFINPIHKEAERKKNVKHEMEEMRFTADRAFRDIVNKLLPTEEPPVDFSFDHDLKINDDLERINNTFDEFRELITTEYEHEKNALDEYIESHPFRTVQEDWAQVIDNSEREIKENLNDPSRARNTTIRAMRKQFAQKHAEGQVVESKPDQKSRRNKQKDDRRYKQREAKIKQLKAIYAKNFQYLESMKSLESSHFYDEYIEEGEVGEGEGEGDANYAEYTSFMSSGSSISSQDDLAVMADILSKNTELSFMHELGEGVYGEFEEHGDVEQVSVEALDEQDQRPEAPSETVSTLNYENFNAEVLEEAEEYNNYH